MKVVLKNVTKRFPSRDGKTKSFVVAADNLDFEIPDGKLVGLLGPSGCGKSTTLNLISGLETPSEGRILFGEDDVTDLSPQVRGIGLVFQNYALYPHLTVKQNIMFPLQNQKGKNKLTKKEISQRAEEAAELVQMSEYLSRKPSQLSGGQQQRVAIARAIVKKPGVLLLDEPLSNLDARLRLQTREEIRRIQKETGITTVFVTHDQDEAMSISDIIVVMKDGSIQQIGKPQTVYDSPVNLFVAEFLGTPPINVFYGEVKQGSVYIGEDAVLNCPDAPDGKVYVAVRPEGFIPDPDGALHCTLDRIEVLGRDISILAGNPHLKNENIRAIVPSADNSFGASSSIAFSLKKGKTLLFDFDTRDRIYCEGAGVGK